MEQNSSDSVFSQLRTTLSKLYPIEDSTFVLEPTESNSMVPRFCWKFFRPDVEGYKHFVEAVRSYRGTVRWVLGPGTNGLTCVVADGPNSNLPVNSSFVGYPPISNDSALGNLRKSSQPTKEFIGQALSDVPMFAAYLEKSLNLENIAPKYFSPLLAAPASPRSPDSELSDFIEPGMQVTWITPDSSERVAADGRPRTQTERRMLHFGITGAEWGAIYSNLVASGSNAGGADSPKILFPLLLRFRSYESVYFKAFEVRELRKECVEARASTSDALAVRGLDKLVLICDWAESLAGNIYFAGP